MLFVPSSRAASRSPRPLHSGRRHRPRTLRGCASDKDRKQVLLFERDWCGVPPAGTLLASMCELPMSHCVPCLWVGPASGRRKEQQQTHYLHQPVPSEKAFPPSMWPQWPSAIQREHLRNWGWLFPGHWFAILACNAARHCRDHGVYQWRGRQEWRDIPSDSGLQICLNFHPLDDLIILSLFS